MSRKHRVAGLVALGAAAAAGAAAVIMAQKMKQSQEEADSCGEEAIFLDLDGDGTVDVKLEDRDGDGQIDTVTADTTGDGRLDTTMADLTGDGEVAVVITGNPEVLKALRDNGVAVELEEDDGGKASDMPEPGLDQA